MDDDDGRGLPADAVTPDATSHEGTQDDSKVFCMMPWVHLHVTQTGSVTPCCLAYGNWNDSSAYGNIREATLTEIWNGPGIREFRRRLLAGEPDPRCTYCYKQEASGARSLRLDVNERFAHKRDWVENTSADGSAQDSKPIYWDIRFSNLCNLSCRICSPWASSHWHADGVAIGIAGAQQDKVLKATKDFDDFVDQLLPYLDELEAIYFAGGEPLLMEEHYQMLELLKSRNRTDVRISYNTNLTTLRYKGRSVCELWREFRSVEVAASLDDSYDRAELQRKGLKWEQIVANHKEIKRDCPHVHFVLSPTISVFNIHHAPEFHREWTERGLIDVADIWLNMLQSPAEYSVSILPPAMKQEIEQLYVQHSEWIRQCSTNQRARRSQAADLFMRTIDLMNSEDNCHLIPKFIERSVLLDQLREESVFDVVPELRPLLAYC